MTTPPRDESHQTLSRRDFLKIAGITSIITTIAGVGTSVYALEIEPNMIDIADVPLTLPRLTPAFDGYRLVQISDIHMGSWMTRERLQHVVDLINEQEPDFVAITGDFVTLDPVSRYHDDLVRPLSQIQAVDGVAATLGNHDHWTDPHAVRDIIQEAGLIDLNNVVKTLVRGDESLHIAGVDDYWERQSDLESVLGDTPDTGAAVLLAHEPDYADISAASGRFDLQISGHSHGGQVILPLIGPPLLPRLAKKYPVGLYQVGDMLQYTNRGIGMISPTVRFNCRPEITVFTLRAGSTG